MFDSINYVETIRVDKTNGIRCDPSIILGTSLWQNPKNPFDVNGDGVVDADDYTELQLWLDLYGEKVLDPKRPDDEPYVDVSGNGRSSFDDLILLYNKINNIHINTYNDNCRNFNSFSLHRDMMNPRADLIVKNVAAFINALPISNYNAYKRNFLDNSLMSVSMNDSVFSRDSLVFIDVNLFTNHSGILNRVTNRLNQTTEILKSRNV